MIDRTDLQLMLLETIFEMGTDELIELFEQLTGEQMTICNEETEDMIGSLEIADAPQLKEMLGFLLHALGERVKIPINE